MLPRCGYAYTVGPQLYRPATSAAGAKSSIRRPSELYSRSSWFVDTVIQTTGAGACRCGGACRGTRGRAGSGRDRRLAGRGPGGWPSSPIRVSRSPGEVKARTVGFADPAEGGPPVGEDDHPLDPGRLAALVQEPFQVVGGLVQLHARRPAHPVRDRPLLDQVPVVVVLVGPPAVAVDVHGGVEVLHLDREQAPRPEEQLVDLAAPVRGSRAAGSSRRPARGRVRRPPAARRRCRP